MANYKLSNAAKEDLIRIHHYGVQRFGMQQADAYFNSFSIILKLLLGNLYLLNRLILSSKVTGVVFVALIQSK